MISRRTLGSALVTLLVTGVVQIGSVAHAHDAVNFESARFRIVEANTSTGIVVERGTHGQGPASVKMDATGTGATEGDDFDAVTDKTVSFSSPIQKAESFVRINDDADVEPLEKVDLSLHDPSDGMVVAFPATAQLTIVDDDGPARVSFEDPTYSVFESRASVTVWLIRSGAAQGDASVRYSTSDGSGIADADYKARSDVVSFTNARWQKVTIPVIDNEGADGDKTFTVSLSEPTGLELTGPSEIEVTIRDDEGSFAADQTPPYTAFHQPLDGKSYKPRLASDLFVFMQDNEDGSGIAKVQIALRKKLASGKCAWWTGRRFKRGSCGKVRWSKEKGDYFTDAVLFELDKRLKPTTRKTKIRHYTAYSRGFDNVGNVQTTLDRGQNFNRFKVR